MHLLVSLVKWVLTLHQLAWFVAGGISCTAITYFYKKLKETEKFNKVNYIFVVLSALTSAFTILWTYDSYVENEVRAANLGLLVFGGLSIIMAIVAHKFTQKKNENEVEIKGH